MDSCRDGTVGTKAAGRRLGRWVESPTLVATVLVTATLAIVAYRPLFMGNLGVVDPELVYRAAQPKGNLRRLLADYGVRTVLNLRGGSTKDSWYADEVRTTGELGVDFYDLPMSATKRPTRRELLMLLDVFERCRYPLLIHCKSGADRTGLASGLYLMAARGASVDEAMGEFSIEHGHVPIGGPQRLHEPFREYKTWLKDRNLPHNRDRLRAWVEAEYRADDRPSRYEPPRVGPRIRR